MNRRLVTLLMTVPLALMILGPLASGAQGKDKRQAIQQKIEQKRQKIAKKKQRERVLSTDIAKYSTRINGLQSGITKLQRKQIHIETDLFAKRSRLERVQKDLRFERARIARLRSRLAQSRGALAGRLVELYKVGKPDVVTQVVLTADGFKDLLERAEYMKRISDSDQRIIKQVRFARVDADRSEARLSTLESSQRAITDAIQVRHNQVTQVKGALVDKRDKFRSARNVRNRALRATRSQRHDLEDHVASLQKEQQKVAGILRGSSNGAIPVGPIRPGSGRLVWPVNGTFSSPFGMRWGRLHAGIDISAPSGTPIVAADSGKVVIAGWTGGYGNYTCIQHGGAFSTCYGHQSAYKTSVGANVSKGQVIGLVGNTGHSFGAHLHFETRVNGVPQNPMGYL